MKRGVCQESPLRQRRVTLNPESLSFSTMSSRPAAGGAEPCSQKTNKSPRPLTAPEVCEPAQTRGRHCESRPHRESSGHEFAGFNTRAAHTPPRSRAAGPPPQATGRHRSHRSPGPRGCDVGLARRPLLTVLQVQGRESGRWRPLGHSAQTAHATLCRSDGAPALHPPTSVPSRPSSVLPP